MEKLDPFIESLQLTTKTRLEVAGEYDVTPKTLISRLEKKGVVLPPGSLFPDSIKLIYYTLGYPGCLKDINNKTKDGGINKQTE